ncbi:MAG TPA: hypothetical protein VMH86_09460 [Rhizomicrobium sp.]|nr:hypothetical protein [Rhizomicrobium sp.]
MNLRTTLTFDPDNAARLKRLLKERDASFKKVVNDLIRHALDDIEKPKKKRKPFRTKAVDLGPMLYPSIKEALQAMDDEYDRKKLGLP